MPTKATILPTAPPGSATVSVATRRYLEQRPDLSDKSQRTYTAMLPRLDAALGDRTLDSIQPEDVRELVGVLVDDGLAPDSVRIIRGLLAGAIDFAGLDPNAARDRTIRMPHRAKLHRTFRRPSTSASSSSGCRASWCCPVAVLDATGCRVSELAALEYRDVDYAHDRLRVLGKGQRGGKIRLVPIPSDLAELLPRVPPEDVSTAGRLWPRVTDDRVRKAMRAACAAAGFRLTRRTLCATAISRD